MKSLPSNKRTALRRSGTLSGTVRWLRDLAQARGPEAKLPTQRELCAQLDVSRFTLDTALDQLEAQDIIRRRQGSGIYVSPRLGRSAVAFVLSAVLESDGSPFWGLLQAQCFRRCQQRMESAREDYFFYITLPSPGPDRLLPPDLVRRIVEGDIHGVIGVGIDFSVLTLPSDHGVPTVALFGKGDWVIGVNAQSLIQEGVRSLAARGCRRIAFWGQNSGWAPPKIDITTNRLTLAASLGEAGLSFEEGLFRMTDRNPHHGFTPEAGAALAQAACVHGAPDFDGVIISNDVLAQGALGTMRDLGIIPGRDIQVVSHTNTGSRLLYSYEDSIIRAEIDPAALAAATVDTLGQVLSGQPPADRTLLVGVTIQKS